MWHPPRSLRSLQPLWLLLQKRKTEMLSAYKFWLLLRALETKVNFSELLWDYQNFTNLKIFKLPFKRPFKDSTCLYWSMSVTLIFNATTVGLHNCIFIKSYNKLKGLQHFVTVYWYLRCLPQECLNFSSLYDMWTRQGVISIVVTSIFQ